MLRRSFWIRSGAIVLLAIMFAEMRIRESSCEDDPVFKIQNTKHSTCAFFSETYQEAREKFRHTASKAGANLFSFPIYSQDSTMDMAVLNGNLPGAVVHTSGLHGVEGFAGSAIQIAFLTSLQTTRSYPTVILVHAVNPYGMAHYRRTNENNVDLNRNALHPDEWGIAVQRDPNLAHYQDFDESLFNPRRAPTWFDVYFLVWVKAAWALYQHGLIKLKRAMVTGQYHDEKGIFYGGSTLQPSLIILRDFLQEHIPRNASSMLTMIHVHTGLGISGQDTIIALKESDFGPSDLATVFAESHIAGLDRVGDEVAVGYEHVMGTAERFFGRLYRHAWIVTQEFGTWPSMLVGIALLLENAARHYLPPEQAVEWTQFTRRAFYIRTRKWRAQVLERGLRVFNQGIHRTVEASS